MKIRMATEADGRALWEIYAQYIDTAITFEYRLPTQEEFTERIRSILTFYPYLVCEEDGRAVGYAYAHRYQAREAYQWNAELSIYLDPAAASRGIGKELYQRLIGLLRLQGVKTVYGLVTSPNEKSERLHRALGFRLLGTWKNTGFKGGAWRDVNCFEKAVGSFDGEPEPLISIQEAALRSPESYCRILGGNCV